MSKSQNAKKILTGQRFTTSTAGRIGTTTTKKGRRKVQVLSEQNGSLFGAKQESSRSKAGVLSEQNGSLFGAKYKSSRSKAELLSEQSRSAHGALKRNAEQLLRFDGELHGEFL